MIARSPMRWRWLRGPHGFGDARCHLLACRGYLLIPALDHTSQILRWCVYAPDRDGTPLFLTSTNALDNAKRIAREHQSAHTRRAAA